MPYYLYECKPCGAIRVARRPVDNRDDELECLECDSPMERAFTPTANLHVHEHFRKLQSDFLPPKGDPSWEHLGRNDQIHEPREEGPTLKEHLKREFLSG